MAVLNVRIECDDLSIDQLNEVFANPDGADGFSSDKNDKEAIQSLMNFLKRVQIKDLRNPGSVDPETGAPLAVNDMVVEFTSTAVIGDVVITPAGTGNRQKSYTIL